MKSENCDILEIDLSILIRVSHDLDLRLSALPSLASHMPKVLKMFSIALAVLSATGPLSKR